MRLQDRVLPRGQPRSPIALAVKHLLRHGRQVAQLTSASTLLLGPVVVHAQTATEAATAPGPATATAPVAAASGPTSDDSASGFLQEVTVTAQRRSQSVQDVPYNISAIDGAQIAQSGAVSINDLTRVVPGLTTVDEGDGARGGTNNLTLRGLRTDSPGGGRGGAELPGDTVNPVSTYFGETPVFFPMPLYDVDRVEVLRGPQGTLYGSGSEAGTIRFVPNRPDFHTASAEVQLDANKSEHSDDPGRSIVAIGNLPITDNLAIRGVAGRIHDGGYVDNVSLWQREGTGAFAIPTPSIPGDLTSGPLLQPLQRDTNYSDKWFVRGAIRWQPSDSTDFQVDYLHQHIYSNNSSYVNPGFPGETLDMTTPIGIPVGPNNPALYPHSSFNVPATTTYESTAYALSPYWENIDLVSAVATIDMGLATLTSSTSFYNNRSTGVSDYTPVFDNPGQFNYNNYPPYNNYPRALLDQPTEVSDKSIIQELRLVSNGSHLFDYVAGLYFQHEDGAEYQDQRIPGIVDYLSYIGQPNPSALGDVTELYERNTRFTDEAIFGELTYHPTHAWQITGGARVFHQSFSNNSLGELPLCGAVCSTDLVNPLGVWPSSATQSITRAIEKINTAYDFSDNLKVYVTYSEGFRRGGASALPTAGAFASLPSFQTFTPDVAQNYEIGVKGSALEHRVRYSADIYRINLNNFQFDSYNLSAIQVTYNGKTARSQGVELELEAALTRHTSVTLGYGFTDAKVTQSFQIFDYPPYALVPSLGGTGQTASVFGGPITAGTRLPGVPKNTATAGVDQTVPLRDLGSVTLHVDGAYRSSSTGDISPSSPYYWIIPSSFIGNLRASWDATDKVSYQAYINNFTGNVGYTGGSYVQTFANYSRYRNVARPRTYGLQLRYRF
jgi:iron complex outermembrane receptor protein